VLVIRLNAGHELFGYIYSVFQPVRLAYQPPVSSTFISKKPAISNQPVVLFSQNKPAPAISRQPPESLFSENPACWLVRTGTLVFKNQPFQDSMKYIVDLFNGSPSHDATQSVTVKQTFLVMKP
jgi:hypothetical protein